MEHCLSLRSCFHRPPPPRLHSIASRLFAFAHAKAYCCRLIGGGAQPRGRGYDQKMIMILSIILYLCVIIKAIFFLNFFFFNLILTDFDLKKRMFLLHNLKT